MQEMYWYIAKDEKGRKGMVPGNFLKPLKGILIILWICCGLVNDKFTRHVIMLE